ncbi:pheromone A receptor-domain-containing protein [Lyophyllum atratum]|nr:pheromone A receptor-domain-containing protein [Lyophyllum atratum]
MRSDLPAVSFICAALLAVFIPVARVRCNVPNLAIVAWLVGCNLVHGINAIIWADNVDIRVPVWCDIVTKLLLGASVALPGACLCISRGLELASSSRPIANDPKSQTRRVLLEFILCYIVPLLYMTLHFVSQDHRFDLIQDYGCSASVHPSTLGLTIMWLPPIILCFGSFVLAGIAIHHSFRRPAATFSVHLESRSPLTSSLFVRRVTVSITTTCLLFVVSLFSVFSVSGFRPWVSWSSVHASMTVVDVVQSRDDIKSIQLTWWGIPAVSIVYIILSFTIGQEARDSFKWIRGRVRQIRKWRPRPLVLLPTHANKTETEMVSRSQLSTPRPKPQALDFKSGWDDMLDTDSKKSKPWLPGRKSPSSIRTTSPIPSRDVTPSPSPTTASPTVCGDDDAFIVSTLDYLGSPVAKTLGITPPALLISPPPVFVFPRKATLDAMTSPTTPRSLRNAPPSPRRVPTDVESEISSVSDASWPQPPPSPLKFVDTASKFRSSSPMDSADLAFGYPLHPSVTPPRHHSKPFEGSSISSLSSIYSIPALTQTRHKRPSVKSLKKSLSSEKVQVRGYAPGDVIYMTVVKEVA